MRFAAFVAVLVVSAFLVSGCSKKKEDDDHLYVCKSSTSTVTIDLEKYPEHHNATFNPATKCPGYKGTGSASNSTSLAPNVPPVLKLKIVDAGGNDLELERSEEHTSELQSRLHLVCRL